MATMTDLGKALTQDMPPAEPRPVVRFRTDATSPIVWLHTGKRGRPVKFGTLLEYVERPSQTPSGGKFIARRCTVRAIDGTRWFGQFKKDATTVILRPAKDGK